MERLLGQYSPYLYAVMRIVVGFLFACHGAQKLFGVLGGLGASGGSAPIFSLMGLAGVIELLGGLCIMLGWLTGSVAFIASGEMAAAYFMSHHPSSFWPILNNGERAVLFCFIFLWPVSDQGCGASIVPSASHRISRGTRSLLCTSTHIVLRAIHTPLVVSPPHPALPLDGGGSGRG
jgi:putative oxidoreductase